MFVIKINYKYFYLSIVYHLQIIFSKENQHLYTLHNKIHNIFETKIIFYELVH
jgi:hypothetical protein